MESIKTAVTCGSEQGGFAQYFLQYTKIGIFKSLNIIHYKNVCIKTAVTCGSEQGGFAQYFLQCIKI